MTDLGAAWVVGPVTPQEAKVRLLLEALTAELAEGDYTPDQTFGYSIEQLETSGVHLLGARRCGQLEAIAGIEVQGGGLAELKRFYVEPHQRGTGAADALMAALLAHATAAEVHHVRLETGDKQYAALRFYARHGFTRVERFSPYEASETSVCMAREL